MENRAVCAPAKDGQQRRGENHQRLRLDAAVRLHEPMTALLQQGMHESAALDASLRPHWQAWRDEAARALVDRIGPDEAWLVPAAPCVALRRAADGEGRRREPVDAAGDGQRRQ